MTQHWGHTRLPSATATFAAATVGCQCQTPSSDPGQPKLNSWLVLLLGPFHLHRATRSHADEDGPIPPFTGQCTTLVAAKVTPGPSAVNGAVTGKSRAAERDNSAFARYLATGSKSGPSALTALPVNQQKTV